MPLSCLPGYRDTAGVVRDQPKAGVLGRPVLVGVPARRANKLGYAGNPQKRPLGRFAWEELELAAAAATPDLVQRTDAEGCATAGMHV